MWPEGLIPPLEKRQDQVCSMLESWGLMHHTVMGLRQDSLIS